MAGISIQVSKKEIVEVVIPLGTVVQVLPFHGFGVVCAVRNHVVEDPPRYNVLLLADRDENGLNASVIEELSSADLIICNSTVALTINNTL